MEPSEESSLVVGPLLRYVGTTTATVWVETDAAGGRRGARATRRARSTCSGITTRSWCSRTSSLDRSTPYDVRLDGALGLAAARTVGPTPAIHTREGERQARLVFGSCRVGAPRARRRTRSRRPTIRRASASTRSGPTRGGCRPATRRGRTGLLLLGDQVYADEVPPETRGVHPRPPRRRRAAGRVGRGLRGVHASSTASRGPTPTSAGCSRRCRRR